MNSLLNFAEVNPSPMSVLIAIFYITLFNHLLENTLGMCGAGKGSVAIFSILSIPARF